MYSKRKVFTALIFGFLLFFVFFPIAIYYVALILDSMFNVPRLGAPLFNVLMGSIVGVLGWLLSFWSVYAQYKYGEGTPAPFVPPVRLVTQGPYKYSRNPMALGNMIFYVGIGIYLGSISYILISVVGFSILFIYNKFHEEKELIERFGEEYLEYMRKTPFLIPLGRRKKTKK